MIIRQFRQARKLKRSRKSMYRTADLRAYPLREYPVIRSRLPYVLALALTLIPLAVDGLAQPSAESVDTKDSEASLDMTMYAS